MSKTTTTTTPPPIPVFTPAAAAGEHDDLGAGDLDEQPIEQAHHRALVGSTSPEQSLQLAAVGIQDGGGDHA
jgi:hypothetical protein